MPQQLPRQLTSLLYLIGLLGCLTVVLLRVTSATAISSGGINAYPTGKATSSQPWFIYGLAAGQTHADSVTIANLTAQSEHVRLYPVDAVLTSNKGFGMLPETSPRQDVASWIHLDTSDVTLGPKKSQVINFTVVVPARVAVGAHYGGIIVQSDATQTTSPTTTSGATVTVIPRLGVRVYETVPGVAKPALTLGRLQASRTQSTITITGSMTNTGNTLLSPTGKVEIRNSLGSLIVSQSIGVNQVFRPGQSVAITAHATIPPNLPQHYSVTATVRYGPHNVAVAKSGLWVDGWTILAILVGIVIVGASGVSIWFIRRHKYT